MRFTCPGSRPSEPKSSASHELFGAIKYNERRVRNFFGFADPGERLELRVRGERVYNCN